MTLAKVDSGPAPHAAAAKLTLGRVWRGDLLSGFQVFLIALPLCLGIAMASGFPPMAGIVTAVVGGLLVSRLSGSYVTINGPAAGLIVVIIDAVQRLGHGDNLLGYKLTLAAVVVAGVLQMLAGYLRLGKLASFFPVSVVHGMLAAIGVTIIAKQWPIMFGAKPAAKSIFGLLATMPQIVLDANPIIAGVGVLSLAILIGHKFLPASLKRLAPAPIIVVVAAALAGHAAGIGSGATYEAMGKSFELAGNQLISLPANVFAELSLPDFSHFYSWDFLIAVISISLVAGIESLLSASAVDKLDPLNRKTDLNRDIFAVGLGTTIAGLLGGLPMIAEIVRSSANASQGAKTQWANFFHGAFLLAAVLLFPGLLRMIPLAALAALLVFTGARLASPAELKKMKIVGNDQVAIFLATLLSVLATDLLVGVAVGVAVKIALHLYRRVPATNLVRCRYRVEQAGPGVRVVVTDPLVFCNLPSVAGSIENLPRSGKVSIDLTEVAFVDHTAMEYLHRIEHEFKLAGGSLAIVESDRHVRASAHPLAARRLAPLGR
jgi:MFS superfamily sulfate permease-like transporter